MTTIQDMLEELSTEDVMPRSIMVDVSMLRDTAAELARLQAIEAAARELVKAHDKEVTHGYLVTHDDGTQSWFVFDKYGRDKALDTIAAALDRKP